LRILRAEFVTSATADAQGIPRDGLPQIALAGRSNVGKSMLINALCRTQIARTSAAPGKTRLANIYRVELKGLAGPGPRSVYLVDLPGYGYARGGTDSANELRAVAEAYFTGQRLRPARGAKSPSASEPGWGPASAEKSGPALRKTRSPVRTLLLVDSRHPGLDADRHAFEWLTAMGDTPDVLATKVDKLSRAERTRNLREIARVFGRPPVPVSSTTGEGLDELWKLIVRQTQEPRERRAGLQTGQDRGR
jgi:GTP-binding protein